MAPGTWDRHPMSTFGSNVDVHSHNTNVMTIEPTTPTTATEPGTHCKTVRVAAAPTNNTDAPASHTIPPALSFGPRSSTCHTWLNANCSAATRPSDVHNRPARPMIDAAF